MEKPLRSRDPDDLFRRLEPRQVQREKVTSHKETRWNLSELEAESDILERAAEEAFRDANECFMKFTISSESIPNRVETKRRIVSQPVTSGRKPETWKPAGAPRTVDDALDAFADEIV